MSMQFSKKFIKHSVGLLSGLALLLILKPHISFAQFGGPPVYVGPIPNTDFKVGTVMTRAVVKDPETGEPFLVEFNEDGTEAGEVDVGGVPSEEYAIMPAADYRFFKQQLEDYKEQFKDTIAKDAELLSKKEFEQGTYLAADNKTEIKAEDLDEGDNSVLVRGQRNRVVPDPSDPEKFDPEQLVLLKFPYDLTQDITIAEDDVSIVVNLDGHILAQSKKTIGFRTGFFGDPSEGQARRFGRITPEDTVFGPVVGTKVYVDEWVYRAGVDVSNNEGKYSFTYFMPLCPPGGFEFKTDVWAELRYKNLLPIGSPSIPYYLRTPGYTYCQAQLVPAFLAPAIIAIQATTAQPFFQSNLFADVRFVSGRIALKNVNGEDVAIGDTTYSTFDEAAPDVTQKFYDFNGDGENDFVLQGRLFTCTDDESNEESEVFHAGSGSPTIDGLSCTAKNPETMSDHPDGDMQGIFFDGKQDDPQEFPDLVRVIDQKLRFEEPVGVLKSISNADLRNTDVLFFREATGQLIMERRGLKEEESEFRRAIRYDEEKNEVAYRILLRGQSESNFNIGGGIGRGSFEEWATANQLTEPFQKREADQPRPGEFIKIVAINRATGYTGTTRVQLTPQGRAGTQVLGIEAEPITLLPPNLKIWAERDYKVEKGLTKDEERKYTIGSEGGALTSDKTVTIYTEWLDEKGKPLPDELGLDEGEEYGLTGRLAKVVGAGALQGVSAGSDLAEFPIAPGRKTQVINVGDNLTTAEHFYVHVIGKPKDQECVNQSSCPSFDTVSSDPKLEARPQLLTPFLVPLSDENKHWQEFNAYRKILRAFDPQTQSEDEKPLRPLPAYAWQYRPEYQFSQFELKMDNIERTFTNPDGSVGTLDILPIEQPTVASSDDFLTALYSLITSQFERLAPIDGEQELILSLGEQEQLITIGEDQSVVFDDIASLSLLDVEDFLTMRLYTNNDAGNILWEYAFEYLVVFPLKDDDFNLGTTSEDDWFIDADSPEIELGALLIGYSARDDDEKAPVTIRWQTDGAGTFSESVQTNSTNGFFETTLDMGTVSPASGTISATLVGDVDTQAIWRKVFVLPGDAANISVSTSGAAAVQGRGNLQATAQVNDAHGNIVTDGSTVRFYVEGNAGLKDYSGLTEDGLTSVAIEGGYFPGDANKIFAEIGDFSASAAFTVNDFQLTAPALASTVNTNDKITIEIVAESGFGVPADGLFIEAFTDKGDISRKQATTSESGTIQFDWHTGDVTGTALLKFKVSGSDIYTREVSVVRPANRPTNQQFFLVGDQATAGTQNFNTLSGEESSFDYSVEQEIIFRGPPNSTENISLGTAKYPNRAPVLLFKPGSKLDSNGLFRVSEDQTRLIPEHPLGIGNSIELHTPLSKLTFEDSEILAPSAPLMNLSVLANNNLTGKLLNLNNGVVLEKVAGEGLRATINTSDGQFSTEMLGLNLAQWLDVSLSVVNNQLSLTVNGASSQTPISGSLQYAATTGVRMAVPSKISAVAIYDFSSAPLLNFAANGQESLQMSFGPSGTQAQTLRSSGSLHAHDAESVLPLATIETIGSIARNQVLLLSLDEHTRLAESVIQNSSEVVDAAALTRLVSGADLYSSGLISRRIVGRFSAGDTTESEVEASTTALINTLKDLPQASKVRASIQPVLDFFKSKPGAAPFKFAMRDIVGNAVVKSAEGDADAFRRLAVPFKLMEELLDTNPAAINFIADSINSRHDLQVWFNIMNVPAKGWYGLDIPVPDVDADNCELLAPEIYTSSSLGYSLTPCRINGIDFSIWLSDLALSDSEFITNPNRFVLFLDNLYEGLPYAPTTVRLNLFAIDDGLTSSNFSIINNAYAAGPAAVLRPLKWLAKIGSKGAKNTWQFFLGNRNHRLPPVAMLYIFFYLQERTGEIGTCESPCKPLVVADQDVKEIINKKIERIMKVILVSGKLGDDATDAQTGALQCGFAAFAHGDMFELLSIAYFHALYEKGDNFYKIKGIERSNPIRLATRKNKTGDLKKGIKLTRRTDIVLEGNGDNGVFIELKSIQSSKSEVAKAKREDEDKRKKFMKKWPRWSVKRGRTTYSRQFILDHIATKELEIDGEDYNGVADDFKWYFHSWGDFNEPRTYERKGKKLTFDQGVPMNKVGKIGDTDFHRVTNRLGQINPTGEAENTLSATLGIKTFTSGKDKTDDKTYKFHIDKLSLSQHTEILDWVDLLKLINIPPEIEQQLFDLNNNLELELVLDIIEDYEEIDVLPDLPVDDWYTSTLEKLGGFQLPFAECDP